MAFDVIAFLGLLGLILLLGIFCAIIAQSFKIPNVLLLLLTGMLLGTLKAADGSRIIDFPLEFLSAIGILALAMIVFESSSRLKLWQVEAFSGPTVRLVVAFLFINGILLSVFTWLLFGNISLGLIGVFATLMSGTDPATVLSILEKERKKIFEILKLESIINTPFVVLLPFIIIDFMPDPSGTSSPAIFNSVAGYSLPFIGQFVVGIGSGVVMGLIVFKAMSKNYSEKISPLAVFTATLLTYVLAELLEGNGVLAVTVLGLFIGNIAISNKENLMKFSVVLSKSLEILVFVLVGLIIRIPLDDPVFIMKSVALFILYLGFRYLAIHLTLRKDFSLKERIFMALNAAKGIAVATVIFALSAQSQVEGSTLFGLAGVDEILNLTLLFLLYSIVVSSVALMFAGKFVELQPGLKGEKAEATSQ